MSGAGARGTGTFGYPKHSSKQLERSAKKNSSACGYESQDVIFGMNAISHVPEAYLDPVLLVGGRRIPSTTFKWSNKTVVDDRVSNDSLRNLEPCDPEAVNEYMEESDSSSNCNTDRPVPKPRARKLVSLDRDVHRPSATATLPPGKAASLSNADHSHSSSTTNPPHPAAAPRPLTAPPPVQKLAPSTSVIAPSSASTTQASQGDTTYEVPLPESKSRPKPPRPPPPNAALIRKYTNQPNQAVAASDKRNFAPSPPATTTSKKETKKPTHHPSLASTTSQRGKQPSPVSRTQSAVSRTQSAVSRTQSAASSASSSDDRGPGVHDYEEVDTFPSSSQPQGGLPPNKGHKSPNIGGRGETPAAPVLPPRSTPAKKRSKLSMLVREQPDKPTPDTQQDGEDSGQQQQQDVEEYSEIKSNDYMDMHPVNHEPTPKLNEESVDTYVDIHPKSAVDDYLFMADDQPGSLYASSDLLANRPDLKI